jgi:hypothetical protein
MPEQQSVEVSRLALDLNNFRTVPQNSEERALQAILQINPDWFWSLVESLIKSGYLPTENILVLRESPGHLVVKEGNRRIGALKLLLGLFDPVSLNTPGHIRQEISSLSTSWRLENSAVPCTVYSTSEVQIVDRIVSLAHGKGERAGRALWTAVARARHNRDKEGTPEPALDLLECYLQEGRNCTQEQQDRWSGDYHLTVLHEAMKKISVKIGGSAARALFQQYPNTECRAELEKLLLKIGNGDLGFKGLRLGILDQYRFIPAPGAPGAPRPPGSGGGANEGEDSPADKKDPEAAPKPGTDIHDPAKPTGTPLAVRQLLQSLGISGANRQKIAALREEGLKLNIRATPLAFCFVVRGLFELSAKTYCESHVPAKKWQRSDGKDKPLIEMLRCITHQIVESEGEAAKRRLHGALTELANPEGLLSVTSLNQLIHNPSFSCHSHDICTTFGRIFPLLAEMNDPSGPSGE